MTNIGRATLLLFIAGIAFGQTSLPLDQIRPPTGTLPSIVMVYLPPGTAGQRIVGVVEIGQGIILDTSGAIPTLRIDPAIMPQPQAPPASKVERLKLTSELAVHTLAGTPSTDSLAIYRNGVLLYLGEDYQLANRVVTFSARPKAGDLVQFLYRHSP